MSAHLYDASVTTPFLIDFNHKNPKYPLPISNFGPSTPNIYGDWLTNNVAAVGRRINYYNVNDYALSPDVWGFNQELKPDALVGGGYYYAGSTNDPPPWNHFQYRADDGHTTYFDIVTNLLSRYDVMAHAAESYSRALGATPGITNLQNVDLSTLWPTPDPLNNTYKAHFWHSGQFRGDTPWQWGYWRTLLHDSRFGFGLNSQ